MSKTLKTPAADQLNQAKIEQVENTSYLITDEKTGVTLAIQATSPQEALKLFRQKLAESKPKSPENT